MSELRIVVGSRGRSQAEDLEIELRNQTETILVGTLGFRGVDNPILPIRSGSSAKVSIPTAHIRSRSVSVSLHLKSFPQAELQFDESLELDAETYRRYVVELFAAEGIPSLRVRRAVAFRWSAGPPSVKPAIMVTDDQDEVHTLAWPKLSPLENGPELELLLDGQVQGLAVSGTYVDDGEEWYIEPEDEDQLELMIEGPAGFYLFERNLDFLEDEDEDEDEED